MPAALNWWATPVLRCNNTMESAEMLRCIK